MIIQPISDIHLEHDPSFVLPHTDADVIVLAGDISVNFNKESNYCMSLAQEHSKPVVFVLGNHSFYSGNFDKIRNKWYDSDLDGVHFLDTGLSYTQDDVTFVGGTLWTGFNNNNERAMDYARYAMNDFRICYMDTQDSTDSGVGLSESIVGEYILSPQRTVDEHLKTLEWMGSIKGDKMVAVTHHSPSFQSVHPQYADDILNHAFSTELTSWIEDHTFDAWIHGHHHNASDYYVGQTRVICNPKGYPSEHVRDFDHKLTIEV